MIQTGGNKRKKQETKRWQIYHETFVKLALCCQ